MEKIEATVIGLENAGKTCLVDVVADGKSTMQMTYHVRLPKGGRKLLETTTFVTKGNVKISLSDQCGEPIYVHMWKRSSSHVSAIVYVVDAADRDNMSLTKSLLHEVLSSALVSGIPLLVLGNKIDDDLALSQTDFMDQMDLKSITDREVCCYMISCKNSTNIDAVIEWLKSHSKPNTVSPE